MLESIRIKERHWVSAVKLHWKQGFIYRGKVLIHQLYGLITSATYVVIIANACVLKVRRRTRVRLSHCPYLSKPTRPLEADAPHIPTTNGRKAFVGGADGDRPEVHTWTYIAPMCLE